MAYKTGLLDTMLFRSFSICSFYEKFHEELVKLKEIFKQNSYSEKFIYRCRTYNGTKVVELIAAKKELMLVLQQLFEIRNRIQCCLKKNAPGFHLKVVFQSRKQLSTLFTVKDKINKMLHSSLVYKFNCNICNDIHYGKTKQHFKVRACEHLSMMPLTREKVKSSKESAVFDHIVHIGHNASFDDFKTLVKVFDDLRLLLRESLLILCDDPPLNRYVKSIPLELFS